MQKPYPYLFITLVIGAVLFCGIGGYVGYNIFQGAKRVDGEADHYADQTLPIVTKTWDVDTFDKYLAPEGKAGQTRGQEEEFLNILKTRMGSLKSAEPFSAFNTQYKDYNGDSVTYVTLTARAKFEKADGVVRMMVAKRSDQWQIVALKVNSHALDDLGDH